MSNQKKKFKIRYVVLGILIILIVAVVAMIGTHWDLIQAARIGLTTDADSILINQEEKDKEIEESLGINGMITEEMIAEAQAEIEQTMEGAAEDVISDVNQQKEDSNASGQPGSNSSGSNPSSGENATGSASSDIVAKYTTKLYGVRGAFQARLNGLISSAKSEYLALSEEQRTSSARNSILYSKLAAAEAMEAECDAAVEAILQEMEAELKDAGENTDPVKQLRSYYKEAKINQKAAYLAQMR